MPVPGKRIGDFKWVTPPFMLGVALTIGIVAWTGWYWHYFLSGQSGISWIVAVLVSGLAALLAIGCAMWTASQFVLWVAVGEDLTFATPLSAQSVAWDSVLGIEFETQNKTIPLVVLPLCVVVGTHCNATITLNSGRELRGRITRDDAIVLHDLLRRIPRLDSHLTRVLSSPRAAMMTFVEAVMEGELLYASNVLDLSYLDEHTANANALRSAETLKRVIDEVWFIDYEEIPAEPDHPSPYVLASGSDQDLDADLRPVIGAITMTRTTESGCWRFSPETVHMIVTEFISDIH